MHRRLPFLAVALLLLLPLLLGADVRAPRTPVVSTPLGRMQGVVLQDAAGNDMAWAFKGVPYAKAPVGDLRWAPPVAQPSWDGVLDATEFGPGCVQQCELQPFACPKNMSEDCLSLNVFVPINAPFSGEELPVQFFMHGGNFYQGLGGCDLYDGRYIANATRTALVTINYRLGVMGFIASDVAGLAGNYGLQDQRLAMETVKLLGKSLGLGSRMVIQGQSAGSESVACHLAMSNDTELFQGAIMESEPLSLPLRSVDQMTAVHKAFAKLVNCSATDVACQRSVDWRKVVAAQVKLRKDILLDLQRPVDLFEPFTPVVGPNSMLTRQPMDAFLSGNYNKNVPIMIGNTAQEAVLFIYEAFTKPVQAWEYDLTLDLIFANAGSKLAKFYPPPESSNDTRGVMSVAGTDGLFLCPNRNVTRTVAEDASAAPLFYYEFDHVAHDENAWKPFDACFHAVCHGAELPFVFHSFFKSMFTWTQAEADLSVAMVTYWSNFVHSGDPNKPTPVAVTWPAYSADSMRNIKFATANSSLTTTGIVVESDFDAHNCDFWDESVGYTWP